MAWIGLDLDDTLVEKSPAMDPETGEPVEDGGEGEDMPTEGSVEFCTQLAQEGHRLTVFTARFKAMPDSEKQRLKEQIEEELQGMGFPPMEVWTGTHKPDFDFYIGNEALTYDGDWNLIMAQLQYMMNESGVPGAEGEEPQEMEEPPPEEA
jgi:hypothetical protein